MLSLTFLQMRSYAVNARDVNWQERCVYTWMSFLWFSSFHTSGSTMMINKRNMAMETVAVLFLATRTDVSQLRRCTSEGNEHFYGSLRQILREFTAEQLIRIVAKQELRMNATFEGHLLTSRSAGLKGYQQTYAEFISTIKTAAENKPPVGPVDVDLATPAVTQLWPRVKDIINRVNRIMKPFLQLFGTEEGNGLSPFAVDIDTPINLQSLMEDYFRPPKRDARDKNPSQVQINNNTRCDQEEDDEDLNLEEDSVDGSTDIKESDIVESFVRDIATTEDDHDNIEENLLWRKPRPRTVALVESLFLNKVIRERHSNS